ncbi:MAG: hypothetical protein CML50_12880 [Rhodobacteraceae bacterium]|jgi:hypothetical protein|uniref:Peptidoglycan binding protein n=1 Tax=Salipiger profundus TaxID=1229727 RepID=A0A1U7D7F0_9RHOB|nr:MULTISPECIES: peptidoglycan-binding domain-containing protein [Salipiger]APX24097.1 hypothetical protein Ga0080559_TMP3301 [Salipiger profundus]MAB06888.1 hypothetical protein [Paracoccaceae bacterium]GFZ94625.1 hypothetical protein GCM10011326_01770 [Salipiger profundus]SFB91202.1 hypothetical protein SAMN05444415_101365 [Salipiger profundus]
MRSAALLILATLPLPCFGQQAPCVGSGFDLPLPGASAVERRSADVPSARYAGIWQEGRVAGYVYQLSSDLSAMLAPTRNAPDWQITVMCDATEDRCDQTRVGAVPDAALPVADMLGQCLLGRDVSAPAAQGGAMLGLPPDAGVTDTDRIVDSNAALATGAGAEGARGGGSGVSPERAQQCAEAAAMGTAAPVQALQTLLAAGGFDPGPADGVMGARTRSAMVEALGPSADDLSARNAFAALSGRLCGE